jgi:hypothetical protein
MLANVSLAIVLGIIIVVGIALVSQFTYMTQVQLKWKSFNILTWTLFIGISIILLLINFFTKGEIVDDREYASMDTFIVQISDESEPKLRRNGYSPGKASNVGKVMSKRKPSGPPVPKDWQRPMDWQDDTTDSPQVLEATTKEEEDALDLKNSLDSDLEMKLKKAKRLDENDENDENPARTFGVSSPNTFCWVNFLVCVCVCVLPFVSSQLIKMDSLILFFSSFLFFYKGSFRSFRSFLNLPFHFKFPFFPIQLALAFLAHMFFMVSFVMLGQAGQNLVVCFAAMNQFASSVFGYILGKTAKATLLSKSNRTCSTFESNKWSSLSSHHCFLTIALFHNSWKYVWKPIASFSRFESTFVSELLFIMDLEFDSFCIYNFVSSL